MRNRKEKIQFESPERLNRLVEGAKIVGDLLADSNLRIDGEVLGNVSTSSKVVIGENGYIKGNLMCQEADIEGKVEGKLSIETLLVLREKAHVSGDIQTSKLHVEEGAIFLGKCNMGNSKPSEDTININNSQNEDSIVY